MEKKSKDWSDLDGSVVWFGGGIVWIACNCETIIIHGVQLGGQCESFLHIFQFF